MFPAKEHFWGLSIIAFISRKREFDFVCCGGISNHAIERVFERAGLLEEDTNFLEDLVAPVVYLLIEGFNRTILEDPTHGECEVNGLMGVFRAIYCEQLGMPAWMIKTVLPFNKLSELKVKNWNSRCFIAVEQKYFVKLAEKANRQGIDIESLL